MVASSVSDRSIAQTYSVVGTRKKSTQNGTRSQENKSCLRYGFSGNVLLLSTGLKNVLAAWLGVARAILNNGIFPGGE
ncbi:hypothetical protein AVEN_178295-1, partial [Araneus ventricosus]